MLHILWDDSHIWGLLAARAVRAMEIPHRLTRGAEIARGLFLHERPCLLLVPGGNARRKATALGTAGIAAIRDYMQSGGRYIGFCGGAGIALTSGEQSSNLAICPWRRAPFDYRLQHFMSGHLHTALSSRASLFLTQPPRQTASEKGSAPSSSLIPAGMPASPLLPVWWPGCFAPENNGDIQVLASYERPGKDFWLADLAIADLPDDIFASWREIYGLSLTPAFLTGQPCIIHGRYGKGQYLLSYSHLETPDSPHANLWLAHLLRVLGDFSPVCEHIPPWQPRADAFLWEDPDMEALSRMFEEVLHTGLKHGLLFYRTDWLVGWRTGIPGANLNNIWADLNSIRSLIPTNAAKAYWDEQRERIISVAGMLHKGCVQYLLAERLSMTLGDPPPSLVPAAALKKQREALFGPAMRSGGPYQTLIDLLDNLARLQLS
ncbi:MAG: biotin--protein ligase [Desulfovibrio sp.]|jgi:hypothetical protein|nr:biotin--protein ligase [Desulfovibrio sp.]